MNSTGRYIGRTTCSFLLVLLLMPLGHALMIIMEHLLDVTTLHYCAFVMGAIGLLTVIAGVLVKNDTKATIFGLIGGLLFWTGWVEFLFSYYAWRYGVHCDLVGSGIVETATEYIDGVGVSHDFLIDGASIDSYNSSELRSLRGSRPEYLIMPATFGMWMLMMMLFVFCTRTGCRFFSWLQRHLGISEIVSLKPMTYLPSLVTFLELNLMLWSLYLALMFCYDPIFLGESHPLTFAFGIGCLIGAGFMLNKQLRIKSWGANIRMSIATVIVFWTFIEVVARNGILKEIWLEPFSYLSHIIAMIVVLVGVSAFSWWSGVKCSKASSN